MEFLNGNWDLVGTIVVCLMSIFGVKWFAGKLIEDIARVLTTFTVLAATFIDAIQDNTITVEEKQKIWLDLQAATEAVAIVLNTALAFRRVKR